MRRGDRITIAYAAAMMGAPSTAQPARFEGTVAEVTEQTSYTIDDALRDIQRQDARARCADRVRTLNNFNAGEGYPIPLLDAPRVPFRRKPHRHKTPHRGTSRRANRNLKRRKARARAR